jgi:hypothetical protein
MSSISMLSEITRGALDPEGWQPLIDARPDWFEVIHLYGTKSGWERLKQLSLTRIPLHDTSTLLTGSPPPLATSMPTGSPAALRRRDRDGQSTRRLLQAATMPTGTPMERKSVPHQKAIKSHKVVPAAQATRKRKIAKRSGIVVRKNASAWVETV